MSSQKHFLLTIDVEDWFQVENFKPWIPFETWDKRELRVEFNVHRLLDLFDSIELNSQRDELYQPNQLSQRNQPGNISETDLYDSIKTRGRKTADRGQSQNSKTETKIEQNKYPENPVNPVRKNKNRIQATFFVLAWLADRLPNLIREIQSRGHEIASHGSNHELPSLLSLKGLKKDLSDSKKCLEDITGSPIRGYRAPSFAINNDILKIVEAVGYRYDSSYNSFGWHRRYGRISLNGTGNFGIADKISDNFYELPVSNLMINRWVLPLGGGAYFRLIPISVFNLGIKKILKHQDAYMFYAHPWEFDPEQPKVHQAFFNLRFRHYSNLSKTHDRLEGLINKFKNCAFVTCREYLSDLI